MEKGIVKWFNKSKGFGFITATDGKNVFVHVSVIEGFESNRQIYLNNNEAVEFESEEGPKGIKATLVRRL